MHGWKNSDAEGTGASTTGKRSPPGDCGGKTQCVERRPAGCAESAREMVPDEATQKETGFGARAIVS